MNVYFRDSHGKKRLLEHVYTNEQVWEVIKKFLDDHNFTSYYTRTWFADGYTWYHENQANDVF